MLLTYCNGVYIYIYILMGYYSILIYNNLQLRYDMLVITHVYDTVSMHLQANPAMGTLPEMDHGSWGSFQ